MSRRQVEFSPRARRHVVTIQQWWRQNRLAAPDLFAEELAGVVADLVEGSVLGVVFATVNGLEVRRVLMPRTRYHLHRQNSSDTLEVVAVWHTSRGRGPELV